MCCFPHKVVQPKTIFLEYIGNTTWYVIFHERKINKNLCGPRDIWKYPNISYPKLGIKLV